MAKYILAFHGGKRFDTKEEGQAHMKNWMAWIENSNGAIADYGNPLGKSKTVTADGVSDGGGANPISGYSLVEADSLDAAVEIAKACPHLIMGTIEVAELMEMNM